MSKAINLLGEKFGRLLVVERTNNDAAGRTQWLCECDCGTLKTVRGKDLRQGKVVSCGCWKNELIKERRRTHGLSKSRLHKIWGGMKKRCYCKTSKSFRDYGERGIVVCDEWRKDFASFYGWAINNGYSSELTIERIDNDKDYGPDNCRWASKEEQSNNKRTSHFVERNGERRTIAEWSKMLGIKQHTIIGRIRNGWNVDDLFLPVGAKGHNRWSKASSA